MSQGMNDRKPLYLSEEEALGLLDLCMISDAEFDQDTVGVLLKLSDLVREHLADRVAEAEEFDRPGGDESRAEPNGDVSGAFQTEDSIGVRVSGTDPLASLPQPSQRPVVKPCPAWRFRSWTVTPFLKTIA